MFIKKFPFIERKEKSMHIFIRDEFDLYKIIHSGQCFRAVERNDGLFRFITGRHVLYIRHIQGIRYDVSCSPYLWNHLWKPYFDLSENYEAIRNSISPNDHYLQKAADYSRGIRILRQDPWETLITFIISQRKSIPAIASAVEKLCQRAGEEIKTPREILYTFPTPQKLSSLSPEDLKACSLGYRIPYIAKSAEIIKKSPHLLKDMAKYDDEKLLNALMELPGVGIKVANCTALFGFHRTALAPVDVWIQRVIDQKYEGSNPFPAYGQKAGIMQQYLFYYAQSTGMK